MSYGVVYCLTNKVNGKRYIGQTTDFKRRMSSYRNGHGHNRIGSAITRHGWANFTVTVLDTADYREELDFLEIAYIEMYHSTDPELGYNLKQGGTGGPMTEAGKAICKAKGKIRLANIAEIFAILP